MRVAVAFIAIWLVLDRAAAYLGSTRGEAGIAVCAIVLALLLLAERALAGTDLRASSSALGLRRPTRRALLAAGALSAGFVVCLPLLASITGTPLALMPNAAWLALGMFAQGGIAEEALFRGFMYRHLRSTRSFWRAAALAAIPFAAAHVPIFWSLDARVALLAVVVAVTWSFPLAWLFDRAGGSIWPGAIVHAVVQSGIKLLVADDPTFTNLAIAWIALGLVAPWLLFLLRERSYDPLGNSAL